MKFLDDTVCECYHRLDQHYDKSGRCLMKPCDCSLFTEREVFNDLVKSEGGTPRREEFEPFDCPDLQLHDDFELYGYAYCRTCGADLGRWKK